MSLSQQSINIERTAHYNTFGNLSKKTKYIWFALHGYGQKADYLSTKFSFLDPAEHFIICPEGLNKFYWHSNNEPVACWMTKYHRYDEITDFVNFLDKLYQKYCAHINQDTRVILFGFSQGCATLWRWIHASQPRFDKMVNWAGWIPEDIGYLHLKAYLQSPDIYLHYGNKDEYLTQKSINGIQEVIDQNELSVAITEFEGKHHIPIEELKQFVDQHIIR